MIHILYCKLSSHNFYTMMGIIHILGDWVVVSKIVYFHPDPWSEMIPNLTVRIFFKWVGSTTKQYVIICCRDIESELQHCRTILSKIFIDSSAELCTDIDRTCTTKLRCIASMEMCVPHTHPRIYTKIQYEHFGMSIPVYILLLFKNWGLVIAVLI